MRVTSIWNGLAAAVTTLSTAGAAMAQEGGGQTSGELPIIGMPRDGAIGFQPAVTDIARNLHWLDGMLVWLSAAIVVLVMVLLLAVAVLFNRKRNKTPALFTHNSPLEITWTLVPVLILVVMGAFSLPILFQQQEIPEADVTVKATGYQWYWGYEYPDHGIAFDSFMLERDELEENGYPEEVYRLATNTAVVVPVDSTVVVQVTAADVIHSWAMPAFGVKQDGIPGRLAELWFEPEEEGIYFGQCSELCGINHAYMPITVKVVSQEEYDAWLEGAIEEYAGTPRSYDVAAAE